MDAFALDETPREFRASLQGRALARGETLFRQGDPARTVFVIERGRIALVRHTPDGRRVKLFSAGAGDSFAEAALFSEEYHCDAVAEAAARVVVIPKARLKFLLAAEPARAERLMARLAAQVQDLRARLELRNIRRATDRVLQTLLLAAGSNGTTVELDRPLKEVAAEIGLTHEAFYRALNALERAGRVRRRGRKIRLLRV